MISNNSSQSVLPRAADPRNLQEMQIPGRISDLLSQKGGWNSEIRVLKTRQFLKEKVQMTNKHKKNCSASLAKKEWEVETTLRLHLPSIRMAIIKKTDKKRGQG
jgi:hypothetical protein